MNWKRHILVHADVAPPDTQRVRVTRLIWLGAFLSFESPLASFMIKLHGSHQLALALGALLAQFPPTHVMTAGDDTGTNAFSHPGSHDVITNFSFHAQQIAGTNAKFCRMVRMNPKRIRMRNLIEPLGVGAPRMNLNRKTKGGNQYRLLRLEIIGMNVTLNVGWNRKFGPTPLRQNAGHLHHHQDWERERHLAMRVWRRE